MPRCVKRSRRDTIAVLVILLYLSLSSLASHVDPLLYNTGTTIRVAFVLAGSPRSFVHASVQESIRRNLVMSFCPPPHCIADVFARVSLTDNVHVTDGKTITDSRGVLLTTESNDQELVERGLSRLLATNGSLHIEWIDIGSPLEASQMKSTFFSDKHVMFRELDPRRYSMYFSRWAAYQLAVSHAQRHSLHYSWIVHSRFDLVFGQPLQPYSQWDPGKMWLQNTWAFELPDVFAILPASLSAAYFSMDHLVSAMCLGGPNFDSSVLHPDALRNRGFNTSIIKLALASRCRSEQHGWSEMILLRKLVLAGVDSATGNIGFAPIFAVLTRKRMNDLCDYLNPGRMFYFLTPTQLASSAIYTGCVFMAAALKAEYKSPCKHGSRQDSYNCLSNGNATDWNFMPFRVRLPLPKGDGCLTAIPMTHTSTMSLAFRPCIATEKLRYAPINASYSPSQLFHLHPLSAGPQPIVQIDFSMSEVHKHCLTLVRLNGSGVVLKPCTMLKATGLFTVQLNRRPAVMRGKQLQTEEFFSLRTSDGLCMTSTRRAPQIRWRPCAHGLVKRRRQGAMFVLERTASALGGAVG